MKCSACIFYEEQKAADEQGANDGFGVCRRHPPVLSPYVEDEAAYDPELDVYRTEHSYMSWCQPRVFEDDWCGEFRAHDTTKA